MTLLDDLGARLPVVAAPMAGGPSSPSFVTAAGHAGALAFLAAGYKPSHVMADEIAAVRAAGVPFGVNLFAPNPVPVHPAAFELYATALRPDFAAYGLEPDAEPVEDDDHWQDKLDVLLADPVPVVSFTFGVPARDVVERLRRAGTVVVQTVTSPSEASLAADAGADALVVQAATAGGHSGTLTPLDPPPAVPLPELLAAVRAVVPLPTLAAGGIATADDVRAALAAGAVAAQVGTVLLLADEAGTSAAHRAGLADPDDRGTVVTHAFTGRPARALRNAFVDRHDAVAPLGYPAVHHLTRPLRQAAAAVGDAATVHMWAGTGYRHVTADPVATILARLTP